MEKDFINEEEIANLLEKGKNPDPVKIREIIEKSKGKNRLEAHETAKLVHVNDPELLDEMFKAASQIKQDVYGNRIVFFAPLYVGNRCVHIRKKLIKYG